MENLDTLLIVFGVLLALIVIGWTIFSHRKEKSRVFSNSFSSQAQPNTPFGQENPPSVALHTEPHFNVSPMADQPYQSTQEPLPQEEVQQDVENRLNSIRVSLPNQTPQTAVQPTVTQHIEQPVQPQVQMQQTQPAQAEPQATQEDAQVDNSEPVQSQRINLFVVAGVGQTFTGPEIVKQLENLGFVYGEYNIFHRHMDNTSASPIIYSVANAYNPGVFDLTQIHQLTTSCLFLFMDLPSPGNDLVNLNQLLSDARDLAQGLGGFVIDDQKQEFNEDSRYRYLAKLRQAH